MTLSYTDDALNEMLTGSGLNAYIGAAALLRIYAGSVPADANAALGSPTLLVEIPLASPLAFFPAVAAAMTMIQVPTVLFIATGAPSFFRIYQSNGTTAIIQGTAGPAGGVVTYDLPLPLDLANPQVYANQAVQPGSIQVAF